VPNGASSVRRPDDTDLLCDGATVSRTQYAALFDAIGTAYGTGDGSTTVRVPDLRGRVPVGAAVRFDANDALGQAGGAERVSLATSELPAHTHGFPNYVLRYEQGARIFITDWIIKT